MRKWLSYLIGAVLAVLALATVLAGFQDGDPIALLIGAGLGIVSWRLLRAPRRRTSDPSRPRSWRPWRR